MPKMQVRVYGLAWYNIPKASWPATEQVFVCKDPQNILGPSTWVVGRMGPPGVDLTRRGLFWEYDDAILFANAINEEIP